METMELEIETSTVVKDKIKINLPYYGRKQSGSVYLVLSESKLIMVSHNKKVQYASITTYHSAQSMVDADDQPTTAAEFHEAFDAAVATLAELSNLPPC